MHSVGLSESLQQAHAHDLTNLKAPQSPTLDKESRIRWASPPSLSSMFDTFSLLRPWRFFSSHQRTHYKSPNDLEEQPPNETPLWPWRRKGRFSTVSIIIPLLLVLATLSLATRIYILHPQHHDTLPLHPNSDLRTSNSTLPPHPQYPNNLSQPLLPSTRWTPTILTTCTPSTQPYYAPCIALRTPGATKGEELIYPDFQLREPVYARSRKEEDGKLWREFVKGIGERAGRCGGSEEGEEGVWYCYRGQHGQNIILANATYTGSPASIWSDESCMGDRVSSNGISTLSLEPSSSNLNADEYAKAYPIDSLLIATSPDSWSFQHFLDRVTHIIAQSLSLSLSPSLPTSTNQVQIEAITGLRTLDPVVSEMWALLGFDASRVHQYQYQPISAKEVMFSCRTPLVHPWLSLSVLERFGLGGGGRGGVPIEERKKIVYFSRSAGHTTNGGRRILNEDTLLNSIRTLLSSRAQDEELVVFDQKAFTSQWKLMRWFEENVRAVVGPHGGGLYNHRWAGMDTLIIELTPTTRPSQMFWEEASMLNQVYANILLPPSNLEGAGSTDMDADVDAVIEILEEYLGRADPRGPAIKEAYRWSGEEVMGG